MDMDMLDRNLNAIQTMKRAGLQRLAKAKGVRAVGPDEQIRAALLELVTGGPSTTGSKESSEGDGNLLVEGVLRDVKNCISEKGAQLHQTGTRRSTRLTVTKWASPATSKESWDGDLEKGAPDTQREDRGHNLKAPLQAPSSKPSDSDEFRAKFDAALTLAGLKLGIRVCSTMKPSATDLAPKGHNDHKGRVDDRVQEGALRLSQRRCRGRHS